MAVSTQRKSATERKGKTQEIDFYFDPVCPWAWRTSVWIREVAKVRPISIRWKFLSLESITTTRPGGQVKESHLTARDPFKVMALVRRELGEEAVDRLYLALGQARHDRKENFGERDVLLACLDQAELDRGLLDRALADPSLKQELEQEQEAIAQVGGFGVPTVVVEGFDPLFGPVINPVPTGEEAGEMWDHMEYFIRRPDFFELKREIRR
jgi:predicted DsbA family dithiol-disulfide isomerase